MEFYFRKTIVNSGQIGILSIFPGIFGEKIETPDSKEFQIHSFSTTTNSTFSTSLKADLKEEKCDETDDYGITRGSASLLLQDISSVKGTRNSKIKWVSDERASAN